MKNALCLLLCLMMTMLAVNSLASCSGQETPAPVGTDEAASGTGDADVTDTAAETATDVPPAVLSEADFYGDGCGYGALVGVDAPGRVVSPVGQKRDGRQIGMFYWIWHGTYTNEIIDTTKIIEQYGTAYALHNVDDYNPNHVPHWWGEPLYGYYSSSDNYIIRRHLALMMYMGVNFIVFDASNTITYPNTARAIAAVICELRAEGFPAPQLAYYTHTASLDTVRRAWREMYADDTYADAWYRLDGKPLIIAQADPQKDMDRTRGQHAHLADYTPEPLSAELLDFFTIRTPAWVGQDRAGNDTWPWIDWYFPPETHGNLMCVSVSSHHWTKYSWMGNEEIGEQRPTAPWNFGNFAWGRGYDVTTNRNAHEDAVKGTYYQSVWDAVIKADPEIAFVSGWNEWCCGVEYNSEFGTFELYDSFNMEYSRDIEMMKGGYGDNFVLQTAANIRAYGYEPVTGAPAAPRTIDISGDAAQWDSVPARFRADGTLNYGRSSRGACEGLFYETPAAVNSLQEVRAASDEAYVYFMLRCDNDIQVGGNRMNLLIGTGTPSQKGWNGYEFLIGRTAGGGHASVERLDAGFNPVSVGVCDMTVNGGVMQLRVPRSLLGLEQDSTLYFKAADSVEHPDDIMDYYVTGRCIPMGRFSYQFIGN